MDQVRPMRWEIIIFILLIIGAVVVGILFFLSLKNSSVITPPVVGNNYTQAFNEGIVMSIMQLMQSTNKCQVASIKYFNITRRLVDIDCVRALLQQQNITLH